MNLDDYKNMVAEQEANAEQPKEEPKAETIVDEPKVDTPKPEEKQTFTVGDKEVTLEELQKGYLRQSDYTKKTTDIAKAREEHKQALEAYKLIESDPKLREALKNAGGADGVLKATDASGKRIRELEMKIANMELDAQLKSLAAKYPDFDEVAVINEAAKRKETDLEFIYKAIRKDDKGELPVDIDALKAELLKELKTELGTGDIVPPTLMDGKAPSKPIEQPKGPTMSKLEHRIAQGMGMTDEAYIKYRDAK